MQRTALVVLATAALVLGLMGPAAADSVVTVKSLSVGPSTANAFSLDYEQCAGSTNENQLGQLEIDGTATVPGDTLVTPTPTRSWTIVNYDGQDNPGVTVGPLVEPTSNDQLTTFKMDVYATADLVGQAVVDVYDNSGNNWIGQATETYTAPDSWQTVDASNAVYTWTGTDDNGDPITPSPAASTLSDFLTVQGGQVWTGSIGFGCQSDYVPYSFQNLQWGAPGAVTTDNFSSLTNSLAISRSVASVTQGGAVTISGSALYAVGNSGDGDGSSLAAQLQAKPFGATAYNTVKSVSVAGDGSLYPESCSQTTYTCRADFAATVQRPSKTTSYRWYYPGNASVDSSYSSAVTVTVHTRIVPAWIRTIRRNVRFTIGGHTVPAKSGMTINLWGKLGRRTRHLGWAKITRTGTFKVHATIRGVGRWSLWFTVPAGAGNTGGTSVHRIYRVR